MECQKDMGSIFGAINPITKESSGKDSDLDLDAGKKITQRTVNRIEGII